MKKKQFLIRNFDEYIENPFLEGLKIPLVPKSNTFVKKDEAIINLSSGNLNEEVLLSGKRKWVDGEQFVKIFVSEMKVLFDLSKGSQKVFSYMLTKMTFDDRLPFDLEDCMKCTGYTSKPPVFKALAELLYHQFIAKTKNQFVYWVNPKLFYRGDRLVILREYRKSKRGKKDPAQLEMFETKALEEGETKALAERLATKTQ